MVRILVGVPRQRSFLHLLVVLAAALLMLPIGSDYHGAFNLEGIILLSVPAAICLTGFVLRWGPLVPCMFLGMSVTAFTPAINRPSYSEISDALIFGLVGVFFGFLISSATSEEFDPAKLPNECDTTSDEPPHESTPSDPPDG